jgi:serine/threonine protein kinase
VVPRTKRGSSADSAKVRVSRASSAKRTADEIISYRLPESAEKYQVKEEILVERQRLINYNKLYFKKHAVLPPTTLDFYKFVKLIGKGAFGKVTLGIHKLTGRYVAIKAIDKSFL